MTILSILVYEEVMVFVAITIYVLGSVIYFFLHKRKSNNLDILPDEDYDALDEIWGKLCPLIIRPGSNTREPIIVDGKFSRVNHQSKIP